MKPFWPRLRASLALAFAALLAACGGGSNHGGGFFPPPSEPAGATPTAVKTLSNRADLVSDGDALIEIVLPTGGSAAGVKGDLNGGTDITSRPALRGNGRMLGVVTGLKPGANTLVATGSSGKGARLVLTNHDRGGPVFAGPQVKPWICATSDGRAINLAVEGTNLSDSVLTRVNGLGADPTDGKCNAPTRFRYYYQPKAKQGSVCTYTTTTGADPCFVEYQPTARPADAEIADFTNDRGQIAKSLLRLEVGTMGRVMYSIIDSYGEIRYTMSDGGSGGSMMQTVIASVMPGLLQGLQTGVSYPDAVSTWIETRDCGLLVRYYQTANGSALSDSACAPINGNQVARLATVFPFGVCDWSKPGVGQTSEWQFTSFNTGPSGVPLGPEPSSIAF